MGGQIVDATIVAAPKQRNTDAEKTDIKAGKVPDAWKDKPAKLRQKDRDARWTVKFSKAKVAEDGKSKQRDIANPAFGYIERACAIGSSKRTRNHAAIAVGMTSSVAGTSPARQPMTARSWTLLRTSPNHGCFDSMPARTVEDRTRCAASRDFSTLMSALSG